jgi:hypothetical protein
VVTVWIKALQTGEGADKLVSCIERRTKPDSIDRLGQWVEVHFSGGDLDYAEVLQSVKDAQAECGDGSQQLLRVMDSPHA